MKTKPPLLLPNSILAENRYESDNATAATTAAAAPQRISFFLSLFFFHVFSLRL